MIFIFLILIVCCLRKASNENKSKKSFEALKNYDAKEKHVQEVPGIFAISLKSNEKAEIEDKSYAENPKLEKIICWESSLTKITKKKKYQDVSRVFKRLTSVITQFPGSSCAHSTSSQS